MGARSKQYQPGYEFPNRKRLTKYVGPHPKFHTSLWMWECMDCGKEHGPSLTNSITRPKKPACCYQGKSGNQNGNWVGYEEIHGVWLNSWIYGARKRGIEWSVTPEQLWAKWLEQEGKCAYTGWQLSHSGNKSRTASLDRRDNTKGYTVDNIQWVHKDINRMKNDYTEEYFLKVALEISQHRA